VNHLKTADAIEMPFASTTVGPKETLVAYNGPLRANTVLCSFNTIQSYSYRLDLQFNYSFMVFVQYDQGQLSTSCMKLVFERPVIRQ